jgi:hypothetical protein
MRRLEVEASWKFVLNGAGMGLGLLGREKLERALLML